MTRPIVRQTTLLCKGKNVKKSKPVHGVAINDANYKIIMTSIVNGRHRIVWRCPVYRVWDNMLSRCYSPAYHKNKPTYKECSVCDDWLLFSEFRKWMIAQDWYGMAIDKDILFPGNNKYSPDTCIFVNQKLNSFIVDCGASRGYLPIGVSRHVRNEKFQSKCRNPFTEKQEHLGLFSTPEQAHEAWRRKKHEHALRYADMQTDERVANALRIRYSAEFYRELSND